MLTPAGVACSYSRYVHGLQPKTSLCLVSDCEGESPPPIPWPGERRLHPIHHPKVTGSEQDVAVQRWTLHRTTGSHDTPQHCTPSGYGQLKEMNTYPLRLGLGSLLTSKRCPKRPSSTVAIQHCDLYAELCTYVSTVLTFNTVRVSYSQSVILHDSVCLA